MRYDGSTPQNVYRTPAASDFFLRFIFLELCSNKIKGQFLSKENPNWTSEQHIQYLEPAIRIAHYDFLK